jgi:hypothetical protein
MSAHDQLLRLRLNARRYARVARHHPGWVPMFFGSRVLPIRALGRRLSPAVAPAHRQSAAVRTDDVGEIVARVERDGFSSGLTLSDATTARLRDVARRATCYVNADRALPCTGAPEGLPRRVDDVAVVIGDYLDVEHEADVAALTEDPCLLDVAASVLRGEPHLIELRLWWSLGAPDDAAPVALVRFGQERFHYDLDDWRCINIFFYLTDVDDEAGPHTVVRGSHRRRRLRHQLSPFKGVDAASLLRFYGDDHVVAIVGPSGSGFVSDPYAFHMGRLPRHDRLMFKLELGCGFRGRGPGMADAHRERRNL